MKCPYNRKFVNQVCQKTNIMEDDSLLITGEQTVLKEEYELMQCFKEDCGVWHNGRCNYNQGSNG